MSDFDKLKQAQEDVAMVSANGNWLGLGIACTFLLGIVLGWVWLICTWPVVIGIITLIFTLPFIIGGGLLLFLKKREKKLALKLTEKDPSVEL